MHGGGNNREKQEKKKKMRVRGSGKTGKLVECGPASKWTDQEHALFLAGLDKFSTNKAVNGEQEACVEACGLGTLPSSLETQNPLPSLP